MTDDEIYVRATINLPGLRAGRQVWVDPSDPYTQVCLAERFLIPVDAPLEEPHDVAEAADS